MERAVYAAMVALAYSMLTAGACAGQAALDSPVIKEGTADRVMDSGGDLSLTCTCNHPVDWDYPGKDDPADPNTTAVAHVLPGPGGVRLSRVRALYMDTGYYSCYRKNKPALRQRVYVYVRDKERPFALRTSLVYVDMVEGERTILGCRLTDPGVRVEVTKENGQVNLVTPSTYDPKEGFILNSKSTEAAGFYYCTAGAEKVEFTVTFLKRTKTVAKPQMDYGSDRPVLVGTNVTLRCWIQRDDHVKVSWEWSVPNKARRPRLQTVEKNCCMESLVTLPTLEHEDSGTYTCVVRDHLNNTNSQSLVLNVIDSTAPYLHLQQQSASQLSIVVEENTTADLVVEVNGFPQPVVTWFNPANKSLRRDHKYNLKLNKLSVNRVRAQDSGFYRVQATNGYETKAISFFVMVSGKPHVALEVLDGDGSELECVSKGFPPAKVTWLRTACAGCKELSVDRAEQRDSHPDKVTVTSRLSVKGKDWGFILCKAENKLGTSRSEAVPGPSKGGLNSVAITCIAVVLVVFLLCLVCFLCYRIRRERQLRKDLQKGGLMNFQEGNLQCLTPELTLDDQVENLPYNNMWEFPREKLSLGRQLGAGAFGLVLKGVAHGIVEGEEATTVAVKMVKRNADFVFVKALATELKIMVHLGKHLNVVNLLGACTNNITKRELLVLVEYCPFGNLQNYLIRHREQFVDQLDPSTGHINPLAVADSCPQADPGRRRVRTKESQVSFNDSGGSVTFRLGLGSGDSMSMTPSGESSSGSGSGSGTTTQPHWRSNYRADNKGKERPLTTHDLVCWAFQVANGMTYLASRKVMHGDLAARNVLLAEDNVVKICDFGLAKSMYKADNYRKKADGPLPIKWMALESIRDRVFSLQSDVWSYGIVLWEFFSLGATPYPGMVPSEEFYNKLVSGYRMGRPVYCPEAIYQLMRDCWDANPEKRPNFGELSCSMGELLLDNTRDYYVQLNYPYQLMNEQWRTRNHNDYLNMMCAPTYRNLVTSDLCNDYSNWPGLTDTKMTPREGDGGYLDMSRPSTPGARSPHWTGEGSTSGDLLCVERL